MLPLRGKSREVGAGARREDRENHPGMVRSPVKCEASLIDVARKTVQNDHPGMSVLGIRETAPRAQRNTSDWGITQRWSIGGSPHPINVRCKMSEISELNFRFSLFRWKVQLLRPPPLSKKNRRPSAKKPMGQFCIIRDQWGGIKGKGVLPANRSVPDAPCLAP